MPLDIVQLACLQRGLSILFSIVESNIKVITAALSLLSVEILIRLYVSSELVLCRS